jgi:hypothetical protein
MTGKLGHLREIGDAWAHAGALLWRHARLPICLLMA